ncbi:MAG: hypothetical protein IJB71_04115 [Bacilli bacterium]|nr:hypothetical protein [Bacilli bacterium]
MEKSVQYVYRYDATNDVYFVRRMDDCHLEGTIPPGLFRQLTLEKVMTTGETLVISNVPSTLHFSEDGHKAFIDLNAREFTKEQEFMIFAGEKVLLEKSGRKKSKKASDENKTFQKVLALFRKKI